MKKILGIGNTLVDILVKIPSDEDLKRFNLRKGAMELINQELMDNILGSYPDTEITRSAGGSAANSIHALGILGCQPHFIGKAGDDEYGEFFSQNMGEHQVEASLLKGVESTGKSLILISPDSERTMATYLGASIELSAADLKSTHFKNRDLLYIEGYLVPNRELITRALTLAKPEGMKIAIDLASFNVVEENLDYLKSLIRDHIDIVFANEDEAKALHGSDDPEKNLDLLSKICDTAVVKIGREGALIKQGGRFYKIDPQPASRLDTTGAGDLFAAGFLYGWSQNRDLKTCGDIGTILASRVIEVIGAKMTPKTWRKIREQISAL